MDRLSARELVAGDWEGWGDLRLDLESMSIHSRGDAGWVAASATVTQTIGEENYASYLEFIKKSLDRTDIQRRANTSQHPARRDQYRIRAAPRGKVCLGVALYGGCRP